MAGTPHSGIRDNHSRGTVGDFLRHHLKAGADLDLVTAYFTVFAYDKLRAELDHPGKFQPYVELCRLFDRQTEQGADMRLFAPDRPGRRVHHRHLPAETRRQPPGQPLLRPASRR